MPKILPLAKLGEPILSKTASVVAVSEILDLKPVVDDMIYTLNSFGNRIGLAAPQIYLSKRIVIYKIPQTIHSRYRLESNQEEIPLTVMINPKWRPLTNNKADGWEACISLPNLMGIVPRFQEIECAYLDLEGKLNTRIAQHFHARVIQHECDHLEGIVFTKQMLDASSLVFEDVFLKESHTKEI